MTSSAPKPTFSIGQRVYWLTPVMGVYGSHLVDGRVVVPVGGQVLKLTDKRVQIQTNSTYGMQVRWVAPENLRDAEAWEAVGDQHLISS